MGTYVITRDENYLKHHGVKGQKWGVRKETEPSQNEQHKKELEEKKKRTKAIVAGVTIAAVGAAVTALIIKKCKGKSAKSVVNNSPNLVAKGKEYVTNYGNVPISNLSSSRRLGIKNYMGKHRVYKLFVK